MINSATFRYNYEKAQSRNNRQKLTRALNTLIITAVGTNSMLKVIYQIFEICKR